MGSAAEDARKYLNEKQIPTLFESLMTGLMYNRPEDPVEFLLAGLVKMKKQPDKQLSWDYFVDAPPTPLDSSMLTSGTTVALAAAGVAASSNGSRPASKDRSRKSSKASRISAASSKRPKTPKEIFEERLSTPLRHASNLRISDKPIIVLFGGPGGGKTKHGARVADYYRHEGMVFISLPELVHRAFNKYNDQYPEWKEAKAMYDRGELLPLDVSLALLKEEMARHPQANCFLLEGYPRTEEQVRLLHAEGGNVEMAIILDYDEDSLRDHMRGRGRNSAVINKRVVEFKEKTLPAAKYYDDRELLHLVPGEQDDDTIFEEMKDLVGPIIIPGRLANGSAKSNVRTAPQNGHQTANGNPDDIPVILVIGAPGSLKSEYCKRIVKRYDGFVHLAMGELLRQKFDENPDDEDWQRLRELMNQGNLVSTEVCLKLMTEAIERHPGSWGFVIEGFPRNLDQSKLFESQVQRIDLVLLIDCTEQFCIGTLAERTEAGTRPDDNPDAIKTRIETFKENTLPMLKSFDEKGKLKVVEGDQGVDYVFGEVVNVLDTALFIPQDSGSGKSLENEP